jgi:hypothetical protein
MSVFTVYQNAVDAIVARLGTISKDNGYDTDAGKSVYVHMPMELQETKLPCISFYDRVSQWESPNAFVMKRALSCQVTGLISAGLDSAASARACESDIVRALWNNGDRTFGGAIDCLNISESELLVVQERETIAGVRMDFEVMFEHLAKDERIYYGSGD